MTKQGGQLQQSAGLLLDMRTRMSQLNPAQSKIARYILQNPDKIPAMSIGTLAKESGVSEATISRFVKFMGCANYRAFQAEMVKNNILKHERIRGYAEVKNADTTSQICQKIFETNIQCLKDSLLLLDTAALECAVELIVKSRRLYVFAQGRSMVTADSIRQRLHRLGIGCTSFSDPHEQAVTASLLREGDVVMGISTYGRSKSVLKNLRIAAARGAKIIGVSSYSGTPLEKIADIMLLASSNEDASFGFEPSCSTISQMILLDCLYIMIANRIKEEAADCFALSCEAIETERE